MRLKRNILCSKPAKLHLFHLQLCSIYYAHRRDYYFIQFGTIFILCTLVQLLFYALRRDYYFMRVSAILCKAIFVIGRLLPR